MTFYSDGIILPTTAACPNPVTLTAQGTAACATTALTVGTHQITATYNDTSNPASHFSSTATELTQSVLEATITNLTSTATPSAIGQSVTFTAVVASAGGDIAPDGEVDFYDGSALLASATLSLAGSVTYTTSTLAAGANNITASYLGDALNDIQPSQATIVQDVQGPSTIAITSTPNPSNFGAAVVFTVSIPETQSVNAQGSVTIYDGANLIGSAPLTGGTGQATFTTSVLAVGEHSITASFPGDASYAQATSAGLTQVVNTAQPATSVMAAPNPAIAGGAITLTATIKPAQGVSVATGTVTFTSGTTTLGSAALSAAGAATLNTSLTVGNYSIVAAYSGDINDVASASNPLSLAVQIATTSTAVTANPNPAVVDSPLIFTANVLATEAFPQARSHLLSMAFPSQPQTSMPRERPPSAVPVLLGNHSITASYSGDANNLPSTSPLISFLLTIIPTTTALATASPTGSSSASQAALVATVTGASGPVATGTITFTSVTGSTSTIIGVASLDSSGVATLTPDLAAGTFSIVAIYGGDALHASSTSSPLSVVGIPSSFTIAVNPSALSVAVSQSATATLTFTSIGGFADSLALSCASLPRAVTCHFSRSAFVV